MINQHRYDESLIEMTNLHHRDSVTRVAVILDGDVVRRVKQRRWMSTKQQAVLCTQVLPAVQPPKPLRMMRMMMMMMMSVLQFHHFFHHRNSCRFHLDTTTSPHPLQEIKSVMLTTIGT